MDLNASQAPFEPIETIDLKLLLLKVALLWSLLTAKWVSELYALSVHTKHFYCVCYGLLESNSQN